MGKQKSAEVTFLPFDVIIVDEPKPTDWVEGLKEPIVIELADIGGPLRPPDIARTAAKKWSEDDWQDLEQLRAAAAAVVGIATTLGHGEERQLTREEVRGFNPGALRQRLQRLRMRLDPALSVLNGDELKAALASAGSWNRRIRRLVKLCEAAIASHKSNEGLLAPNIIAGNHAAWGTGVRVRLRLKLTKTMAETPTLLLDATGDVELLRLFWPGLEASEDIRVQLPEAVKVVQVSSTLAAFTGWAPAAEPPPEKASKAAKDAYRRTINNMLRLIHLIDVVGNQVSLGMVVPKRMHEALSAALDRRSWFPETLRLVLGHHGAIRGQNIFSDVRVFLNLGRMAPQPRELEDLAETLFERVVTRLPVKADGTVWYNRGEGNGQGYYIMRGGGVVMAEHAEWHPDPDVERLRRQITDAEADQADGRSRGIRRTAATPLLHIRATALPSQRLEVDELGTMDDVLPFDAFDALFARGVLVPTGNAFKGGQRLLATMLSFHESQLTGETVEWTPKAVKTALARREPQWPKRHRGIYLGVWATESAFTCNAQSFATEPCPPAHEELRRRPETWSEWSLPWGSRYATTLFLRLPVGTDDETAVDFLEDRTCLYRGDIKDLEPKESQSG